MTQSPKFSKVKLVCQFLMLLKMAYSDFPQKRLSVAVKQRTFKDTWHFSTLCLTACNSRTSEQKTLKPMSKKFSKCLLFMFKISVKSAKLLKSYSKSKLFNLKRTPDMSTNSVVLLNYLKASDLFFLKNMWILHFIFALDLEKLPCFHFWILICKTLRCLYFVEIFVSPSFDAMCKVFAETRVTLFGTLFWNVKFVHLSFVIGTTVCFDESFRTCTYFMKIAYFSIEKLTIMTSCFPSYPSQTYNMMTVTTNWCNLFFGIFCFKLLTLFVASISAPGYFNPSRTLSQKLSKFGFGKWIFASIWFLRRRRGFQ